MKYLAWLLFPLSAFGVNHAVVAGSGVCANNGDGSTWACAASPGGAGALNAIPATLARGDIYYLADGSYPNYVFNTATAGTTTIEIRKAQTYDHGPATGWNAATMGSGQAEFSHTAGAAALALQSSYLIVNGNGTQTSPGCGGAGQGTDPTVAPPTPTDCGIKFDAAGCTPAALNSGGDNCGRSLRFSAGFTNFTFEYLEMLGTGNNDGSLTESDHLGAGNDTVTWFHIFGHMAACMYDTWKSSNDTTSWSYFWWLGGNRASCHTEYTEIDNGKSNIIAHDNVFRDINGTSIWAWTCGTCGTTNNVQIYNNLMWYTQSWPNLLGGGESSGLIGCFNGNICTNVVFAQNTIVNYAGNNSGFYVETAQGGYMTITIENNIWYGTRDAATTTAICPQYVGLGGTNVVYTRDHNSFLNGPVAGCNVGTGDVSTSASTPNPFTNWPNGDFTLASQNVDWNNGSSAAPLNASPYLVDHAGVSWPLDSTRDRGAYQSAAALAGGGATSSGVTTNLGTTTQN